MRALTRRETMAVGFATVAARAAPAAAKEGDDAVLARLVPLERRAEASYRYAAARELGRELDAAARVFAGDAREHVRRLAPWPSGPRPVRAPLARGLAAARGRRAVAAALLGLEEETVAAYYDAVQRLADPKLLMLAAQIMGNHGQHLVVLRQALGANPVPNAIETGGS